MEYEILGLDLLPIYIIFIPIVSSLILYLIHSRHAILVSVSCQMLLSAACTFYFYRIFNMDMHIVSIGGWARFAGVTLRNDHLSMSFAVMSVIIWWCVIVFAFYEKYSSNYLFFILFLEGTFMGLLMSNDLFNLFVFIEIVTIISTMLITFKKDGAALKAGFYYLIFNNAGMLFYLVAFIIIYSVCGTLNLQLIKTSIGPFKDNFSVRMAYVMITAAFGVKSAFFPVYTWLPKAHSAAPSAISALLSGLLVKSGLYEFIRLNEVFHYSSMDMPLAVLGSLTAFLGVLFALCQNDIKLILAFSTVSQIGIMFMGIGPFKGFLYSGGLLHLMNHSLLKSLLFLGAGIIISEYKNKNVMQIRGVFARLPMTSIFMIIGMLSITGMPYLNGYVGKSIVAYSLKKTPWELIVLQLVNIGTAASFIKLSQIFFINVKGVSMRRKKRITENVPLLILSIGCIVTAAFYIEMANLLVEVPVPDIIIISPRKIGEYVLTMFAGFALYKLVLKHDPVWVKNIRHFDVSFANACMFLVGFVVVMSAVIIQ
ncbi:complex I subunit 5 family protein [Peptoclostridium litorale]|nr:proton-conducting transporter membrane subunit [Peptoclostridium litorale]